MPDATYTYIYVYMQLINVDMHMYVTREIHVLAYSLIIYLYRHVTYLIY